MGKVVRMEYDNYDTTFFSFLLTLQKDAYLSSELSFVGSSTFFSGVLTNIYSSLSNVQYCYSMTWFSLHLSDT